MNKAQELLSELNEGLEADKIIKKWALKRDGKNNQGKGTGDLYRGSGEEKDFREMKKLVPDLKEMNGTRDSFVWAAFSDKELFTVSYTEGDIVLITFKDKKGLKEDIKETERFAKEG